LVDLQNEMKSLKSLLVSRRATSNVLEQASSAPATPSVTAPATPSPAAASPTDGLSSRLSATINGSGARAGIPAWQMAAAQQASNTNTTSAESAATTEVSGSSSSSSK
jgi:peroxin-14